MPRQTQYEARVIAMPQGRAVVASAKRLAVTGKNSERKPRNETGWQERAWMWYDVIGEFRFACAWVGNVLSRAVLHVQHNGERTEVGDAVDALNALFGGAEGQKEMFRQLGIQFTVAGEGYIVGEDGGEKPDDQWFVVAASELTKSGDDWKIGKKADHRSAGDPTLAAASSGEQCAGLTVARGASGAVGDRRTDQARRRTDRFSAGRCGHPADAGQHLVRHHHDVDAERGRRAGRAERRRSIRSSMN